MQEDNKTNESALELRLKQVTRYVTLGLLGVLALCLLLFMYIGTVKENEKAAISNTQVQADQTKDSDTCKIYPEQELCVLARKIAANPTQAVIPKDGTNGDKGDKGDQGNKGETGRGVASFDTNAEGNLIVTFTDGQTENAGKVVGKNGIDGINGKDGANGRGILSTALQNGNLILNYTDGTSENVGMVVGPAGQDGQSGTNGTNGISVVDLKVDSAGYVQVTYSTGEVRSAGRIIVNIITKLTCQNDTLTITMADGSSLSATVDCTPDNIPPAAPAPAPTPAAPAPQSTTAPLVKIP